MLTRYITGVTTAFSPFNPRSGKTLDISMFGQSEATRPAKLLLKFKDGKELDLDLEKMKIKDIEHEVNRHSRGLLRQEELSGDR